RRARQPLGQAARRDHRKAIDGTGRNAEFATRAQVRDHGVHQLAGADDRVHGTGLDALGAADARVLVDHGDARWYFDAVFRIEWQHRLAGNPRQYPYAFRPARRTAVDRRFAARDGFRVRSAGRIAATRALRLWQGGIDPVDQRVKPRFRWQSLHIHRPIVVVGPVHAPRMRRYARPSRPFDSTGIPMSALAALRALDSTQRHTVAATFLGWTLDAFDYFLLVMVMPAVADSFHVPVSDVAFALLLTLAFRPLGALIFGRLADRYGRRRILMIDVTLYSVLGLACAFARSRGIVSGILQSGYPCGYLLCAIAYGLLFNSIGWRGMFALGIVPALLVLYLRRSVPESPVFEQRERAGVRRGVKETMRGHWKLLGYMIVTMAVFNAFSHGSQDVYPTFLKLQMHFRKVGYTSCEPWQKALNTAIVT